MMKTLKFLLLFFLLRFQYSLAATLDQDIQKLAQLADVGTNHGTAVVNTYSPATFQIGSRVKYLLEALKDSPCKFSPAIGSQSVLSKITSFVTFSKSEEAIQLLNKLEKDQKIEAAIGYYWDGDDGFSDSCATEGIDIYFTNGKVLNIGHNSTN